jgi:hypothetical protein
MKLKDVKGKTFKTVRELTVHDFRGNQYKYILKEKG